MRIADIAGLVLSFCVISATSYQYGSKEDYIKWRERLLPYNSRHHHHRRTTPPPSISTTTTATSVTSENDVYYEQLKLRHHSRFPDLDRVMQKIDNMQTVYKRGSGGGQSRTRPWQNPHKTSTVRTTTTTENSLFEDYGDLVDEEEEETDYVSWEDGDQDDEYEDEEANDEDDPFADAGDEWQAEEATEPAVQQATISAFTKFKWDNYGTRPRVEESRRQQLHLRPGSEQKGVSAAVQHYMRVRQEGQCRRPLPKVIPVQQEHPDPSKTYTPHCTILHRCAEDTGCCAKLETRCGPKKLVPVHLYFYAKTLGVTETKVEKLIFYNHTECACLETTKTSGTVESEENLLTEDSSRSLSFKSATYPVPLYSENLRRCKCPAEFTAKYRYDSGCSCDCEEDNQDCMRMKRGKEFLSMKDRRCIMDNQCGTPLCEYGVFLRHIGRCQLKQEKLDSYRKVKIND